MNVFWLDYDVLTCSKFHCDKHVVNQLKEYAQILSTAMFKQGIERTWMYEPAFESHPVVEWVAERWRNFMELTALARCLSEEYNYRYGRVHKSFKDVISNINPADYISDWESIGNYSTTRPRCVNGLDDRYVVDDVVETYRNYYIHEKDWEMSWTGREVPEWYE